VTVLRIEEDESGGSAEGGGLQGQVFAKESLSKSGRRNSRSAWAEPIVDRRANNDSGHDDHCNIGSFLKRRHTLA